MRNLAKLILVGSLSLFGGSNCFAEVPSFLDITIGGEYPLPIDWSKSRSNNPSPTEQFRAPNKGKYSSLFPEYEVSVLRENNQIAMITAERTMVNVKTCVQESEKLRGQLAKEFPTLEWEPQQQIFGSDKSNYFYKVTCTRKGGSPFWELHYQARGKLQDELLKSAWNRFIGRRR